MIGFYSMPLANVIPDSMRLTPIQENLLAIIKTEAKARHEKARKAAAARGRHSFPALPFECSWAFEMQFFRAQNE